MVNERSKKLYIGFDVSSKSGELTPSDRNSDCPGNRFRFSLDVGSDFFVRL